MKITFDSNIWRKVVSPHCFPNDEQISAYRIINQAIREGVIVPYISETIFTLEAIKKTERKSFVKNYRPIHITRPTVSPDGRININMTLGPDISNGPYNSGYLDGHLQDALQLGFKIIRFPRIGMISNPVIEQLPPERTWNMPEQQLDKLFEIDEFILSLHAGVYAIQQIGFKYNPKEWFDGIGKAPDCEDKNIAKAFAEWADGDSVAAHISVGGDYFCTNDIAQTAGVQSILSKHNLEHLYQKYAFKTISPDLLAKKVVSK